MIIYFLLNDKCAIIDSSCRHVRVMKTPYTPVLYSKLSVHIANHYTKRCYCNGWYRHNRTWFVRGQPPFLLVYTKRCYYNR